MRLDPREIKFCTSQRGVSGVHLKIKTTSFGIRNRQTESVTKEFDKSSFQLVHIFVSHRIFQNFRVSDPHEK